MSAYTDNDETEEKSKQKPKDMPYMTQFCHCDNNRYDCNHNRILLTDPEMAGVNSLWEHIDSNTKIWVWWVDEKEWRPATVVLKWEEPNVGYFINIDWPEHEGALPEEMNLFIRSVYERIRLAT